MWRSAGSLFGEGLGFRGGVDGWGGVGVVRGLQLVLVR